MPRQADKLNYNGKMSVEIMVAYMISMSYALFFNDNSNGSLHHGEVNTTDRPICAQKGLSCRLYDSLYLAALYNTMELVSYFTTVADFIIIPLLVYLSFSKVKDGIFKYFTLNLMAVCSIITIADLVVDIINIINLFADVGENKKHLLVLLLLKKYRIRRWARRCLSFGNIWIHALALYAAIICYLLYGNPIFYTKHFVYKSQKLHYVILHISLLLWNSCIDFMREQFSIVMPYHLTHLILFIASFTVAAMASIGIYKYKPLGVSATSIGKLRRKRLFSFVIYCYATEIIVLPLYSLMSIICDYIGCEQKLRQTLFYSIIRRLIHIFHELNSIATGLSTIVALEPYRQAVLSIFRKQRNGR
uniref:G-protein coupled receptors family 1 profile domain-containing protein n=1 Tax=Wuchereria bancrofti TaxID=6293 RepID=A0A1I8EAT0_WUCBA